MQQQTLKPILTLLLIWLLLTAVNIAKPFQMDDGFHMEAAKHILSDPLHPMSGMIRWDFNEPTPMYVANQPPLLFFMIAGMASIFGFNEIPLHLLISIFSFLALFWFYKSVKIIESKTPLTLLTLFGLCPAFMVSQNMMTDIPILSLLVGALYYLLLWDKTDKEKYSLWAVILLSIAVFIKYTILPALAVTAFIFVWKKKYRNLLYMLIPIGLLLLWTAWNYWEFGASHLLSRKAGGRSTLEERVWSFFTCLGSIAPFGALLLTYLIREKIVRIIVYVMSVILALIAIFSYTNNLIPEEDLTRYLEIAFLINGVIVFLVSLLIFFKNRKVNLNKKLVVNTQQSILFFFLAALLVFIIILAPFMGLRHVLLLIPMILLLANPIIEKCSKQLLVFSIAASFVLSFLLAISDWKYAYYYKNSAISIMKGMPVGSTVWATGTGAWQWYSKQFGMKQYSVETTHPQPGDYLVIASGLPAFRVDSRLKFILLAKVWGKIKPLNYVNVSEGGSIYHTTIGKPSWRLSKNPIDTIFVCQVVKE